MLGTLSTIKLIEAQNPDVANAFNNKSMSALQFHIHKGSILSMFKQYTFVHRKFGVGKLTNLGILFLGIIKVEPPGGS